jgi:hypothetical protein
VGFSNLVASRKLRVPRGASCFHEWSHKISKFQIRFDEIADELAEIEKHRVSSRVSEHEGKLQEELKAIEWVQDMEALGE